MDLVTGFPKTPGGPDSIWVVIDRLSNIAHFIPIQMTYSMDKLAKLYLS